MIAWVSFQYFDFIPICINDFVNELIWRKNQVLPELIITNQ